MKYPTLHSVRLPLPVRSLPTAKSRLLTSSGRSQQDHEYLVLAMMMDTVTAALACPRVRGCTVVTRDEWIQRAVQCIGAGIWMLEKPGSGLNGAIQVRELWIWGIV
jgi:2-phospho-L-lactate guanylyltransferase